MIVPLFSRISETLATLWRESTGDIEAVDLLDEAQERSRKSAVKLSGDGRYCTLLTPKADVQDRWAIVAYVRHLQATLPVAPPASAATRRWSGASRPSTRPFASATGR